MRLASILQVCEMLQPGVQERFRVKGFGLRGLGVQGFRGLGF